MRRLNQALRMNTAMSLAFFVCYDLWTVFVLHIKWQQCFHILHLQGECTVLVVDVMSLRFQVIMGMTSHSTPLQSQSFSLFWDRGPPGPKTPGY